MEGEVRRIHIIYFLSRKGQIEHPHLFRVHLSRNGVRLRDVKRWLGELRGKDMPESFAWSYKRRYKTGYVWQDLVDEDLITPSSDNEYVLKGSEIPSSNNLIDYNAPRTQEEAYMKSQEHSKKSMDISTKTSPPSSPEASTFTDNSINLEKEKLLDTNNKEEITKQRDISGYSCMFYSTLLTKTKDKKKNDKVNLVNWSTPSSSKTKSSFNYKSKGYTRAAITYTLRSLFNCGAVDINDPHMVKMTECDKELYHNIGGSKRVLGTSWNQHQRCPSAR